MLKQTIEYTDFDDNKCVETLYFNITKAELAENLNLKDRLEDMAAMMEGARRGLETEEINQIIALVKTFMKLSYGVRSADGKRFVKTNEQWTEFTQTAAYDAFLFSLFSEPNKAVEFMSGVLPTDLREQAMKFSAEQRKELGLIDTQAARDQQDEANATPQTSIAPAEEPKVAEPEVTPLARPEVTDGAANNDVSDKELEQFRNWQKANSQHGAKL